MSEDDDFEEETENGDDPAVPTDLLDLYVQLEDAEVSPEDFKEAFGA